MWQMKQCSSTMVPTIFMYYPKYATSSRGFVLGSEEDIPDP